MDTLGRDDLASLLGVTPTLVSRLAQEGVIAKITHGRYPVAAVTQYCAHIRAAAAGREQPGDVSSQRARLLREQADGHALRNAATRGELVAAGAVESAWADVLRGVRSAMLAVPSRVRQRLPTLTAAEVAEIDAEVRAALAEAASDV